MSPRHENKVVEAMGLLFKQDWRTGEWSQLFQWGEQPVSQRYVEMKVAEQENLHIHTV